MLGFRVVVRALTGLALACLWFGVLPCHATEGSFSTGEIVEEILVAAFPGDAEERALARDALVDEIESIAERFEGSPPTYRRARRLHDLLHEQHLLTYDAEADGIHQILEDGRFNCLSATLLEGLAARELGYDAVIVQYPRHVLLRLSFDGRIVDVESTSPDGFDVHARPELIPVSPARAPSGLVAAPWATGYLEPHGISVEEAVAFVWLNRAHRSLEDGEALEAARCVAEARRFLPDLAEKVEGVRPILGRAFRLEYDAGRFDDAYAIAFVEVDLFPGLVSTQDRILAAALKRVEQASEDGDPYRAQTVIDEVGERVVSNRELLRFERKAYPLVAVAAATVGDWAMAERAADQYAVAEPDLVEVNRLLEWIELRRSQGERGPSNTRASYPLPPPASIETFPF